MCTSSYKCVGNDFFSYTIAVTAAVLTKESNRDVRSKT